MIDILYLAKGRPEFTAESLKALAENTDWTLVRHLIIATDGETMREGMVARAPIPPTVLHYDHAPTGGPVNAMLRYLARTPAQVFCKLDNDVIVPPGWLEPCVRVMVRNPELSFLGIEPPASRTRAPWSKSAPAAPELSPLREGNTSGYAVCDAIGGIGLMRSGAFSNRVRMRQHSTYGGFTDWQLYNVGLVKGWIVPPLKLFLLDRLPFDPWLSLSKRYIAEGSQRPWTNYAEASGSELWDWWRKTE